MFHKITTFVIVHQSIKQGIGINFLTSVKYQLQNKTNNYQLMKELLPAEWLPISKTVIFFLGVSSVRFKLSAIFTSPATHTIHTCFTALSAFGLTFELLFKLKGELRTPLSFILCISFLPLQIKIFLKQQGLIFSLLFSYHIFLFNVDLGLTDKYEPL